MHLDDRHSPTQRSDPRATQADAPRAVSLTEKDRISLPMLSANSRQQSGIKPEAPHGLPNSQRSSPDRPPVAGTRSSMSRPRPLQEEIDQLEHDLVELERRLEKKDKQLQQLASEVIRSKGDRLHVIPDQQLRLMWDDVDWKLKDWALTYSPNFWKPSFALREWSAAVLSGSRKDYTSERLARVFCGDSKEFQRCVTHNGARRRLVRSFVWDSLRSKIFENRMAYLGANIANSFHNIQEQVRANHGKWRSGSVAAGLLIDFLASRLPEQSQAVPHMARHHCSKSCARSQDPGAVRMGRTSRRRNLDEFATVKERAESGPML